MYKRQITVNPAHPENALPTYSIGFRSAGIIVIDGIPQGASSVRILVVKPKIEGAAFQFDAVKVGTHWEVSFMQDEFLTVGEGQYELDFTLRSGNFWSSKGKFIVVQSYNGGIVPPGEDPDLPHYFVTTVNGVAPDESGNVNTRQVPDLSDLSPLLPGDSDRATKNLLNALLTRLKGA